MDWVLMWLEAAAGETLSFWLREVSYLHCLELTVPPSPAGSGVLIQSSLTLGSMFPQLRATPGWAVRALNLDPGVRAAQGGR